MVVTGENNEESESESEAEMLDPLDDTVAEELKFDEIRSEDLNKSMKESLPMRKRQSESMSLLREQSVRGDRTLVRSLFEADSPNKMRTSRLEAGSSISSARLRSSNKVRFNEE